MASKFDVALSTLSSEYILYAVNQSKEKQKQFVSKAAEVFESLSWEDLEFDGSRGLERFNLHKRRVLPQFLILVNRFKEIDVSERATRFAEEFFWRVMHPQINFNNQRMSATDYQREFGDHLETFAFPSFNSIDANERQEAVHFLAENFYMSDTPDKDFLDSKLSQFLIEIKEYSMTCQLAYISDFIKELFSLSPLSINNLSVEAAISGITYLYYHKEATPLVKLGIVHYLADVSPIKDKNYQERIELAEYLSNKPMQKIDLSKVDRNFYLRANDEVQWADASRMSISKNNAFEVGEIVVYIRHFQTKLDTDSLFYGMISSRPDECGDYEVISHFAGNSKKIGESIYLPPYRIGKIGLKDEVDDVSESDDEYSDGYQGSEDGLYSDGYPSDPDQADVTYGDSDSGSHQSTDPGSYKSYDSSGELSSAEYTDNEFE